MIYDHNHQTDVDIPGLRTAKAYFNILHAHLDIYVAAVLPHPVLPQPVPELALEIDVLLHPNRFLKVSDSRLAQPSKKST